MARLVRALFSAHVSQFEQIFAGQLFYIDDPLVVAHPDWFSTDLEPLARGYNGPRVEEATAEPGVRRARKATAE